jgi:hypothetical protein
LLTRRAKALQKLYERASTDSEHTFSSFEDARRCLRPADQLGLSSVFSCAVEYLESIPWTRMQTEELLETVSLIGPSAATSVQGLLSRTVPLPGDVRTGLADQVIAKATVLGRSDVEIVKGTRRFIQEFVGANPLRSRSKHTANLQFAASLRRCLAQLEESLQKRENQSSFKIIETVPPMFEHDMVLIDFVCDLAWMFYFPGIPDGQAGGSQADGFAST